MRKIAVMGDYDSIYGFQTVGLSVYPVSTAEDAKKTFHKLASGAYGIIFVTEALCEQLSDEIEKYRGELTPAVIPIPGVSGNTGRGIEGVKKTVEQAVGSDILFSEEGR